MSLTGTATVSADFFGFDSGAEDEEEDEEDEAVAAWRCVLASRRRVRPQSADTQRPSTPFSNGGGTSSGSARRHSASCSFAETQKSALNVDAHFSGRSFHIHNFDPLKPSAAIKRCGQAPGNHPVYTPLMPPAAPAPGSVMRKDLFSASKAGRTLASCLYHSQRPPLSVPKARTPRPNSAGAGRSTSLSSLPPAWVPRASPATARQQEASGAEVNRRPSSARRDLQSWQHEPRAPRQPAPTKRGPRDLRSLLEEGIQGYSLDMPPSQRECSPACSRTGADASCVICLERLRVDGSNVGALQALPCGHAFHTRCIQHWLATNPTCPLCKSRVVS